MIHITSEIFLSNSCWLQSDTLFGIWPEAATERQQHPARPPSSLVLFLNPGEEGLTCHHRFLWRLDHISANNFHFLESACKPLWRSQSLHVYLGPIWIFMPFTLSQIFMFSLIFPAQEPFWMGDALRSVTLDTCLPKVLTCCGPDILSEAVSCAGPPIRLPGLGISPSLPYWPTPVWWRIIENPALLWWFIFKVTLLLEHRWEDLRLIANLAIWISDCSVWPGLETWYGQHSCEIEKSFLQMLSSLSSLEWMPSILPWFKVDAGQKYSYVGICLPWNQQKPRAKFCVLCKKNYKWVVR